MGQWMAFTKKHFKDVSRKQNNKTYVTLHSNNLGYFGESIEDLIRNGSREMDLKPGTVMILAYLKVSDRTEDEESTLDLIFGGIQGFKNGAGTFLVDSFHEIKY